MLLDAWSAKRGIGGMSRALADDLITVRMPRPLRCGHGPRGTPCDMAGSRGPMAAEKSAVSLGSPVGAVT